jgi:ElaB/YqjD/DUF883 family membrane-anchored ribosome-binding protein
MKLGLKAYLISSLPRSCCSMNANNLTEQAGQKAQDMGQKAKDVTGEISERAKRAAEDVKEATEAWSQRAKTTVRDAAVATDEYVHEYAWSSIALVALTAGVIGFLLGNRRG